jgi:hypothetical protein
MNRHAYAYETAPQLRAVEEIVLHVRFKSSTGLTWAAVGGGTSVGDAIESARESLPDGTWVAVSWDDLYGD